MYAAWCGTGGAAPDRPRLFLSLRRSRNLSLRPRLHRPSVQHTYVLGPAIGPKRSRQMSEAIYYVYGVTPPELDLSRAPGGLDGGPLELEVVGSLAALVSRLDPIAYSPA